MRPCVSETFAEKVVQNAVAGMVQRREQQSLALRRKPQVPATVRSIKRKLPGTLFVSPWQLESSGGGLKNSEIERI